MARKDNKGRNLKTGEYQRPDGRYEYRYKDEITGKRNSVYAADLLYCTADVCVADVLRLPQSAPSQPGIAGTGVS